MKRDKWNEVVYLTKQWYISRAPHMKRQGSTFCKSHLSTVYSQGNSLQVPFNILTAMVAPFSKKSKTELRILNEARTTYILRI